MMMGLVIQNGIVIGFEFSLKNKIVQIHLTCFSLVFVWGLEDGDGEN
jgi:hypothetical protein